MRLLAALLLSLTVSTTFAATSSNAPPTTTNNDDSCDVGVFPAATLLLPYFEVDVDQPPSLAGTTLFTVANVGRAPQIVRITVWSDLAYPVLTFHTFLTGYDVQSFNLYDVVARGLIASTTTAAPRGSLSSFANPNFDPRAADACASVGGPIPPSLLAEIRSVLTTGTSTVCGTSRVGESHPGRAIGYATIDVVATCSSLAPTDAAYYSELLYDNVLTGDSQQVSPNAATGNYAGGNPLVHIRAIPEGGAAGRAVPTHLPYTFYDRLTPAEARTMDRRQPLPSSFSARWIEGGGTGFKTDYTLWREGVTSATTACASWQKNAAPVADFVRFDERENPTQLVPFFGPPPLSPSRLVLPAAVRASSASTNFPPATTGDVGGWMYLNLNNGGSTAYSATRSLAGGSTIAGPRPSQNWASVTLSAEQRYSVQMDATMLANGCSPAPPGILLGGQSPDIGPGGNPTP